MKGNFPSHMADENLLKLYPNPLGSPGAIPPPRGTWRSTRRHPYARPHKLASISSAHDVHKDKMTTSKTSSVVWASSERKKSFRAKISNSSTTSIRSPRSPISHREFAPSPSPWIDLRSIASDDEDKDNEDSDDNEDKKDNDDKSFHSISHVESDTNFTPSEGWELAAGYEKGGFGLSYYETYPPGSDEESKHSSMVSKRPASVKTVEKPIVYPSKVRLFFIGISLVLSTFPTALDRTIVATAMYLSN